MSIYGSMNFTSITESTSVISCSKKNTDWVRVYSENGKYYISVDEYEPSNTDNFDYVDTLLVTATYKDGILYCEKAERCYDEKKKDVLVRPENELLSTYQKFQ